MVSPSTSQHFKTRVLVNLSISAFIVLFLFVFKPFDIGEWTVREQMLYCAGYGLCTLLGLWIIDAIIFLRRGYPVTENRIRRQVIISLGHITVIAILNFIYSIAIGVIDPTLAGFFLFFGFTLAVGIFPTLALIYPQWLKRGLEESDKLELRGENEGEILALDTDQLLLIKSESNYCKIWFHQGEIVRTTMIRATIKALEKQLGPARDILRCHRSYICNLRKVEKSFRRDQRLQLHIGGIDQAISCSRKLSPAIRKRLFQLQTVKKGE